LICEEARFAFAAAVGAQQELLTVFLTVLFYALPDRGGNSVTNTVVLR
jgi:hypothetical protein